MEKNILLCIGRQIGSGGKTIGERLSKELGIQLYDKEILSEAARQSGLMELFFENVDEKASQSFLNSIYSINPMLKNDPMSPNLLSNDALFVMQSDAIRQIATQQSAIFIGRCADYILKDYPNVMSVFITASLEDRVKRISNKDNVTPEDALKTIRKIDKQRASYYNYYTDKIWGAAASYDLCVDSTKFGISRCVEIIKSLL